MTTQVRASHILVTKEDDANRIRKRIADGEDFAAVAKRFSSCPSKKNGGDLGWFGKGQMVPEFETAAFAAEQAQSSGRSNPSSVPHHQGDREEIGSRSGS